MKIQPLIAATTLTALFTGCAGRSPTRLVGNTIGVAGGALLGSTLGKRNPLATAAGAGAGLLLSATLFGIPLPEREVNSNAEVSPYLNSPSNNVR